MSHGGCLQKDVDRWVNDQSMRSQRQRLRVTLGRVGKLWDMGRGRADRETRKRRSGQVDGSKGRRTQQLIQEEGEQTEKQGRGEAVRLMEVREEGPDSW